MRCAGYDTKLCLIVTIQFWGSGKCGVSLHCHYFLIPFRVRVVITVRVLSRSQIDLLKTLLIFKRRYPRGVMVKAMGCGVGVSEFKLQSRYYIHFWTSTLKKGMSPLFPQLWVKLYHYCYYYIHFWTNTLGKAMDSLILQDNG